MTPWDLDSLHAGCLQRHVHVVLLWSYGLACTDEDRLVGSAGFPPMQEVGTAYGWTGCAHTIDFAGCRS